MKQTRITKPRKAVRGRQSDEQEPEASQPRPEVRKDVRETWWPSEGT